MENLKRLFSEQFDLYKSLYELENGKIDLSDNISRKTLVVFILEKRKEINKLLSSHPSYKVSQN
jgi:hypothetical protein